MYKYTPTPQYFSTYYKLLYCKFTFSVDEYNNNNFYNIYNLLFLYVVEILNFIYVVEKIFLLRL